MTKRILLFVVLVMGATACGPRFHAMTTPPPGRTAHLTEKNKFWGGWKYGVRITEGTVLAVGCDCSRLSVSSDDSRLVTVMKAHATNKNPATQRDARVASFVIVGLRPGKTRVRVHASNGNKTIPVTVEPAEQPRSVMKRASVP
jgi:hypothetical protein